MAACLLWLGCAWLALSLDGLPCAAVAHAAVGIAQNYPNDKGIGKDPDVLFAEDFEEGSLAAIRARWEDVKDSGAFSLTPDVPPGSGGKSSLRMTHVAGVTPHSGGHLYRRLQPGYEQVYMRMYVKFDPDSAPFHHFGTNMGGNNPATPWPMVSAGNRPRGDQQFWVGFEPHNFKKWDFYTYWMEMRSNPGGGFWGNGFIGDPNLKVEKGKWICIEMMMKVNSPTQAHNGELAVWIDGMPWTKSGQVASHLGPGFPKGRWIWDHWIPGEGGPFEGFRWRTTERLLINYLWLYIYSQKKDGSIIKVGFDDVVVARRYIGPIHVPLPHAGADRPLPASRKVSSARILKPPRGRP